MPVIHQGPRHGLRGGRRFFEPQGVQGHCQLSGRLHGPGEGQRVPQGRLRLQPQRLHAQEMHSTQREEPPCLRGHRDEFGSAKLQRLVEMQGQTCRGSRGRRQTQGYRLPRERRDLCCGRLCSAGMCHHASGKPDRLQIAGRFLGNFGIQRGSRMRPGLPRGTQGGSLRGGRRELHFVRLLSNCVCGASSRGDLRLQCHGEILAAPQLRRLGQLQKWRGSPEGGALSRAWPSLSRERLQASGLPLPTQERGAWLRGVRVLSLLGRFRCCGAVCGGLSWQGGGAEVPEGRRTLHPLGLFCLHVQRAQTRATSISVSRLLLGHAQL
mmetsp:Transcript_74584/g.150853  ORF Transcript_74584/g.150853 Transcript_74584/m.150853 type:complete len:324 (+) Transcript_74584:585-1556(+)